jgi:hypothetical protein
LVHEVGEGPLDTGHHRPCACAEELEQEPDHLGLSERATAIAVRGIIIAVVVGNAESNEGVDIWWDDTAAKPRMR